MINTSKLHDLFECPVVEADRICACVCEERQNKLDDAYMAGCDVGREMITDQHGFQIKQRSIHELDGMFQLLYDLDVIDHDEYCRLTDEAAEKISKAYYDGIADENKEIKRKW